MRLWCKMRPQPRRRRFSRHITFCQHLREGTQGGARAAGSEAWQAKRQLILPIRIGTSRDFEVGLPGLPLSALRGHLPRPHTPRRLHLSPEEFLLARDESLPSGTALLRKELRPDRYRLDGEFTDSSVADSRPGKPHPAPSHTLASLTRPQNSKPVADLIRCGLGAPDRLFEF